MDQQGLFYFRRLEAIPDFVHAVSSRTFAFTLKDARQEPKVASVRAQQFFEAVSVRADQVVFLDQVHSDQTIVLEEMEAAGPLWLGPADGVIVLKEDIFATIRTADCLPLMLIAPQCKSFAAFHAGRRGTLDRLVEKGVKQFLALTRSHPHDVIAVLGPCIRNCCYEVGGEIRSQFERAGHDIDRLFKGNNLDLIEANQIPLRQAGIGEVIDSEICTSCRTDQFFSYRAENTRRRIWTLAGFRQPRRT